MDREQKILEIKLAYNVLASEGYITAAEANGAGEQVGTLSDQDVNIEYKMHVIWAAEDKAVHAAPRPVSMILV